MPDPGTSRDRELLQRFRAGDRDAFTDLYRAHSPAIFRLALHSTADRAKATEVTQDVFVWLIHHAGEYQPERAELSAFLTGVTRKFLLRRRSEEHRWVRFEEAPTQRQVPEREPHTSDVDRLRAAIAALPERYREVVALCDLEGRSYEETAGKLSCAVGTVRSRLHRARSLLARKLAGETKSLRCSV